MIPFYERDGITIYCGETIATMTELDRPFDAIIADLPYGTTACSWDVVIPFKPLWEQYKRLTRGAVVLFGSQPFTSVLVMSCPEWFKWETVWHKSHASGHLNCKVMPLREHENLLVFGKGRVTYNPQMTDKLPENIRPWSRGRDNAGDGSNPYGKFNRVAERTIDLDQSYPRSVLKMNTVNHGEKGLHPTQKPLALLAYLIRTYTNPGEIILDNTMGSGTTLVAAQREGRRAVGIEISEEYCKIAVERLKQPTFWSLSTEPKKPPRQAELAI